MKKTTEKIPAEALKFHFGDEASTCEFADAGEDGKVAVKIKARSREPIDHWYWGRVIHDMAGMRLAKKRIPVDYCHREDEILGALDTFDTESGDLQTSGFLDAEDARAAEISRKGKKGVPYEASIFFDRRTVEAERLGERESATVNGGTVRGPVTIIRKWTLRGVAVTPYGYDPKTSTRFSEDSGDVEVTLLSNHFDEGGSTMSVDQSHENGQAADNQDNPVQMVGMFGRLLGKMMKFGQVSEETPGDPNAGTEELSEEPEEKPEKLSADGEETPADPPEDATELGDGSKPETPAAGKAPGQAFIDRFGLEQGAVYFAQGLSMEEAMFQHSKTLEKKLDELTARIEGADLGSDEAVSFSGANGTQRPARGTGDAAMDAFCANIKMPGQRS